MSIKLLVLFVLIVPAALAAPPAEVPLTVRTITYGATVTLTAKSSTVQPGAKAQVMSRPCGFSSFVRVATPEVRSDGTFAYNIGPTLNTLYRVLLGDRDVVNLSVRVRPALKLTRLAGNRYRVEATTGNGAGLGGRSISLQQRSTNGRWKTVGSIKLQLISRADQIDAVAAGTATVANGHNGPVRALLGPAQAAPCFAPTFSTPAP